MRLFSTISARWRIASRSVLLRVEEQEEMGLQLAMRSPQRPMSPFGNRTNWTRYSSLVESCSTDLTSTPEHMPTLALSQLNLKFKCIGGKFANVRLFSSPLSISTDTMLIASFVSVCASTFHDQCQVANCFVECSVEGGGAGGSGIEEPPVTYRPIWK